MKPAKEAGCPAVTRDLAGWTATAPGMITAVTAGGVWQAMAPAISMAARQNKADREMGAWIGSFIRCEARLLADHHRQEIGHSANLHSG